MLSKIALPTMAFTSVVSADTFHVSSDRSTLESIRNAPMRHPVVRGPGGDCADGAAAVTRLKKGPDDIVSLQTAGATYTDSSFVMPDSLFWDGYESSSWESAYDSNIDDGTYTWQSWKDISSYQTNSLFVDPTSVQYNEVNQGGAGTCYFMAAIAAAGEWPSMITDMFITGTDDSAIGLYGIKFYVRGKPWVVTVDDKLLFSSGSLLYAQPADDGAMWAPILEKAWSKIKGNYAQSNGGFVVSGLRSLIGSPTFTYTVSTAGLSASETFTLLNAANAVDYPMGAGTAGGSDSTYNDCGIAYGHAYSILGTFEMDSYDMVMLRNPWGVTYYDGDWNKDDTNWTDDLASQVLFGIDPRTSNTDGIFVMEASDFVAFSSSYSCINDYQISHYRDAEGYSDDIFDKEDDDGSTNYYYVTVPADDGALYFSAESYYQQLIPNECTTGTYQGYTLPNPVVDITLYEDGSSSSTAYKLYSDQFTYPMLLTSYSAGVVFTIKVTFTWFGSPAPDYTIKLYTKQDLTIADSQGDSSIINYDGTSPSGFTDSVFCGMDCVGGTNTTEEEEEITNLGDVLDEAFSGSTFMAVFKIFQICFEYPEICFNPLNWI